MRVEESPVAVKEEACFKRTKGMARVRRGAAAARDGHSETRPTQIGFLFSISRALCGDWPRAVRLECSAAFHGVQQDRGHSGSPRRRRDDDAAAASCARGHVAGRRLHVTAALALAAVSPAAGASSALLLPHNHAGRCCRCGKRRERRTPQLSAAGLLGARASFWPISACFWGFGGESCWRLPARRWGVQKEMLQGTQESFHVLPRGTRRMSRTLEAEQGIQREGV